MEYLHCSKTNQFNYFYFTLISIYKIYLVFVMVCVIIEIFYGSSIVSVNQKRTENKKSEFEEAVNKAIKMVVLNTDFGIFFKLIVLNLPLINLIAQI